MKLIKIALAASLTMSGLAMAAANSLVSTDEALREQSLQIVNRAKMASLDYLQLPGMTQSVWGGAR